MKPLIERATIPDQPGVYLFKDADGDIIYIGKANSLRARVSSYFTNADHSPKTQLMISRIADAEFILVDNEVEALLLENRLIKQHKPKYNILLKDAKSYAYIKVTDERFPRILSTRRVTKDGTYFGPYPDGTSRNDLVQLIIQLFKLRTRKEVCKRPCLNYHLGLCSGPCIGAVSAEEYQHQVEEAKRFLHGDTEHTTERLTHEMHAAAHALKFEEAQEKKRQLEAITILHEHQKVDRITRVDQDVVALHVAGRTATFALLSIVRGVIRGKRAFRFELQDGLFEEFLKSYYTQHPLPNELIVNQAFWTDEHEKTTLEEYFARKRGATVTITCPQRGDKRALARLAEKNASLQDATLLKLQEALGLARPPIVIECFDASNLGSEHLVAAMTRWVNGEPDRNGYRRFELKSFTGKNDDFAAINEAVRRRYARLKQADDPLPDLILIDGGQGQLAAALAALTTVGLTLPVVGLAKKEEALYLPGRDAPLRLDANAPEMLLLRRIRDSVHRLALSYNQKKRQMKLRAETK